MFTAKGPETQYLPVQGCRKEGLLQIQITSSNILPLILDQCEVDMQESHQNIAAPGSLETEALQT